MPGGGSHTLSTQAIQDLRLMKKLTLGTKSDQGDYGGAPHIVSSTWYWGKLASAMTAGTLESPTSTTVDVWFPDTSGSEPWAYAVTTDADLLGMTVYNRSSMTGSSGTMVKIEFVRRMVY